MALVDAMQELWRLDPYQLKQVHAELMQSALDRQRAMSADHPAVAEFWEVYNYLQSLDESSQVNHSGQPGEIAINLNDVYEKAAHHRQNLIEIRILRSLLRGSRTHKFVEANKAVHSIIRQREAARMNTSRSATVKCWVFKEGSGQAY